STNVESSFSRLGSLNGRPWREPGIPLPPRRAGHAAPCRIVLSGREGSVRSIRTGGVSHAANCLEARVPPVGPVVRGGAPRLARPRRLQPHPPRYALRPHWRARPHSRPRQRSPSAIGPWARFHAKSPLLPLRPHTGRAPCRARQPRVRGTVPIAF